MANEIVFGTRMSRWIVGFYSGLLIFLDALFLGLSLLVKMPTFVANVLLTTSILITLLFAFILYRAYNMKFTLTKDEITIKGIFNTNHVPRRELKSVKKTLIPFGFRLGGASFLGGWYYFPGIGTAWVSMGNFSDGVLITTKNGKNFVITPRNPENFITKLKKRK